MCSGFFRAKPNVSMAPLMRMMKRGIEFMGRQWNLFDIASLVVVLYLHLLALLAPVHFSWGALWLAFALYVVTGLGVTLGFHRSLAHRSFKLPRWLEYFFVYCGVLTLQVRCVRQTKILVDWIQHFTLLFITMLLFFMCREVQLNGWARTGTTTSLLTQRKTLIALSWDSGLATLVGYWTTAFGLKL